MRERSCAGEPGPLPHGRGSEKPSHTRSKFDEQLYFSEVFDRVIAQARAAHMDDLAETIDGQRRQFSFTVTEH